MILHGSFLPRTNEKNVFGKTGAIKNKAAGCPTALLVAASLPFMLSFTTA
jgi:hypothetical protein